MPSLVLCLGTEVPRHSAGGVGRYGTYMCGTLYSQCTLRWFLKSDCGLSAGCFMNILIKQQSKKPIITFRVPSHIHFPAHT